MSSVKKLYYFLTCKQIIDTIANAENQLQYDGDLGVYRGSLFTETHTENIISASPVNINRSLRRQIQSSNIIKND